MLEGDYSSWGSLGKDETWKSRCRRLTTSSSEKRGTVGRVVSIDYVGMLGILDLETEGERNWA